MGMYTSVRSDQDGSTHVRLNVKDIKTSDCHSRLGKRLGTHERHVATRGFDPATGPSRQRRGRGIGRIRRMQGIGRCRSLRRMRDGWYRGSNNGCVGRRSSYRLIEHERLVARGRWGVSSAMSGRPVGRISWTSFVGSRTRLGGRGGSRLALMDGRLRSAKVREVVRSCDVGA